LENFIKSYVEKKEYLMTKKKLDTLVEDIYDKLSVLSDGESLNIDDKTIDAFGESMKEVLSHWANPKPRDSGTLRMSNIGKPMRQLWYDMRSESKTTERIKPSVFIKFLYGHLLEEVLLMLIKIAGHKVTDEQKEVSVSGIKGHMDCVIDGEVVDIKTASGFAFKKFYNKTLAEDDIFGYLPQLAGYEAAMGTNKGGFLAMNKESGEIALYRPDSFDKPDIKKKIKTVKKLIKIDTPPELCYNPVPDGASGNMKIARGCTWCRHKFECHADSNEGQGLRVFKYSKGYTYLTQTVKTPNVLEVTK
jgi:hypothetical protein|tara:strand:- start:282 stop:1193 length:912 start_codon:yes stop_codon:yes gene_type:complete